MPVTQHPPHSPVLALLTHTVLTLDVLTQSAPQGTDAESRLPVAGSRVSPEIWPRCSGFVGSADEVATTTGAALRTGTLSFAPRCVATVLPSGSPDAGGSLDWDFGAHYFGIPSLHMPLSNASDTSLPPHPHGSGSGWFATPIPV